MTSRARWVRRADDKRPLTISGTAGSSTNSRTWATYEDAVASSAGVGLGFVLNGDGIGVIDLDHAIVDGVILPWAAEILAANPGTFAEVSQSGEGVHIWGLLAAGRGRKIRDGRNVEFYSTGRYVALGTPVAGTTAALLPLNLPAHKIGVSIT
ncbi:DNA primase [Arthrobacter alpinus]|nr:DNA primase [Arthrobacter alpinus]